MKAEPGSVREKVGWAELPFAYGSPLSILSSRNKPVTAVSVAAQVI
jgi:hypothetical protein